MCLKIADDIGLFKHIGAQKSPAKSIDTLAAATSVEPALLKRIARHLAARNILLDNNGSALGSYGATHISEALATREGSSGIRHLCHVYTSAFLDMPRFLEENGYKTPSDARNGTFQQSRGLRGLSMFECLQREENKHLAEDFNLLMKFTTKGRRSFLDVCDIRLLLEGRRGKEAGASRHLFVDIGGGTGTDAVSFRTSFAEVSGTVELQELDGVIEAARNAGVEYQDVSLRVLDFFSPQPVRGSRFYFMGSVLHDWPDTDAKRILENVAAAMEPGFSTLLLSENVLPNENCHPHLSAIDLTMMTMLASKERSEEDWKRLLEDTGLKIIKIHSIPSCLKSVLECELR